jgi:SAM-dependent methyltransferase
VSQSYADVDASPDPEALVRDQEAVDRWPQVQAYKRRSHELVGAAEPVLDVGCGPGGDIVALGPWRSFGVDGSLAMGAAAVGRGARVAVGDALALPFAGGAFGAVRADRVLQHLADPVAGVAEMVRVTAAGGRVVVADPDQETLVIQVPGVRPALADRVKALRRDVGYRNGRFVSSLPALLAAWGLVDVSVEAFPLVLTDPDVAFGLPGWPTLWRTEGGFTDDDLDEWAAGMDRARRDGGLVYALLYFVVAATKIAT